MNPGSKEAQSNEPAVADVCLMLEGTYPYVLGGVSAWVDQIIKGLPELKFRVPDPSETALNLS